MTGITGSLPFARTGITATILMPARLMGSTVQAGSWAASLSGRVPGITGIGATAITATPAMAGDAVDMATDVVGTAMAGAATVMVVAAMATAGHMGQQPMALETVADMELGIRGMQAALHLTMAVGHAEPQGLSAAVRALVIEVARVARPSAMVDWHVGMHMPLRGMQEGSAAMPVASMAEECRRVAASMVAEVAVSMVVAEVVSTAAGVALMAAVVDTANPKARIGWQTHLSADFVLRQPHCHCGNVLSGIGKRQRLRLCGHGLKTSRIAQ